MVDSCGGGLYAHRYRTGSGFMNPSVYCADLEKIITHVRADEAARRRPGHWMSRGPLRRPGRRVRRRRGDLVPDRGAGQRARERCSSGCVNGQQRTSTPRSPQAGASSAACEKSAPAAVREVLAHPYVRAWAEHCLRTRRRDVRGRRSPGVHRCRNGHQVRGGRRDGDSGRRRACLPTDAGSPPGRRRPDGRAHRRRQRTASRCGPGRAYGASTRTPSCRLRTGSLSVNCARGSSRCDWKTPTPTATATNRQPHSG